MEKTGARKESEKRVKRWLPTMPYCKQQGIDQRHFVYWVRESGKRKKRRNRSVDGLILAIHCHLYFGQFVSIFSFSFQFSLFSFKWHRKKNTHTHTYRLTSAVTKCSSSPLPPVPRFNDRLHCSLVIISTTLLLVLQSCQS